MDLDPRPIGAVFLDAAGTLFHVQGSVGKVYSDIAARYGIHADPQQLERDFIRAFHSKSTECLPSASGSDLVKAERRWWQAVVESVFGGTMDPPVLESYFDEVFEAFRHAGVWQLYPDTLECLDSLAACGYRLGIISNFDSRLFDVLRELGIDSFFEHVVISWQAGAAKPDARIFQAAVSRMRVDPGRALHVGDSLHEDIQGARAAGLQAVLLDRTHAHVTWTDTGRVESLQELSRVLDCQP